ncbi:cell envelope integrity protein TolA [Massilia pinisoli]|uniref:Cell envelope integrity protein TolA n=1 Tax=Massilia pinisoli TaxID=1772194 RepID=A0ABT1ZUT7_9BURK|nr:cell envelope integrity protein TolA [Massilia pinisoli]MCS0583671.1 cell envelope integrity protein TolA [Massilia pinisoli]
MSATKHNNIGNGSPYEVPPEPNRWPAIGLAVGVHALLLAFLWIGISWQNNTPIAVEAEIWDVTTQTAAPPPTPAPEPEPEPETPPPQPAPKAAVPPPVVEQPQPKQPDIALEREKKRKEELKRKQAEEERERELEQKRADDKKAKALAEKKERELEEKKAKAEAEKKEAEKKKKDDAEKKKKEDAEKKKKAAEEQKKLDAARDAEMRRITGAAGNPTNTGKAEKSTAPRNDPGYSAAITAKVKGNTSYAGSLDEPGNPTATFRVEQLPTGEIISVKKIKSSGVPSFDDAVEKGISKSSPLPKKKDGTVERSLVIEFHMKDLQ